MFLAVSVSFFPLVILLFFSCLGCLLPFVALRLFAEVIRGFFSFLRGGGPGFLLSPKKLCFPFPDGDLGFLSFVGDPFGRDFFLLERRLGLLFLFFKIFYGGVMLSQEGHFFLAFSFS